MASYRVRRQGSTCDPRGNGRAGRSTDKRSGREYFCQGDDAADFERETRQRRGGLPGKSKKKFWLGNDGFTITVTPRPN